MINIRIVSRPLEPWTRDDNRACANSKNHNTRTNHSSVEPSPSPGVLGVRRIGDARTLPSALAVNATDNAITTPGAPAISRIENVKTACALAVRKIGIPKSRPGGIISSSTSLQYSTLRPPIIYVLTEVPYVSHTAVTLLYVLSLLHVRTSVPVFFIVLFCSTPRWLLLSFTSLQQYLTLSHTAVVPGVLCVVRRCCTYIIALRI